MGSVSHSEVDSFLLCRRKHYYGYGLGLQRISESQSLAMGSAGHSILEAFYKVILAAGDTSRQQKAAWDDAYQAAIDEYGKILEGGFTEADNRAHLVDSLFNVEYGYFTQEPFVKEGYVILAVEMKFNLEYDTAKERRYPFVVDLIVRAPDGDLIVVDHKFVYDFYTQDASDLQPQIPKYIGALRALNYKISHGAYNMVRTRKIKAPTLEQMHSFMPLKPNNARVLTTFEEQIGVAMELEERKALPIEVQRTTAYRTANKMVCQSCSFKDICTVELIGGNVELMKKTEYKVREKRDPFEVSEDAA